MNQAVINRDDVGVFASGCTSFGQPGSSGQKLSPALISALEKRGFTGIAYKGRVRRYRKGQMIFLEGEVLTCYYILLKGSVKVFKQALDGKTVTLATWPAIGTFGDMNLVDQRGAGASVEALTDVEVLVIERGIFVAYIRQHPEVYDAIMRSIVERLRFLQERLLEIVSLPVEQRLVRILLSLSEQFGKEVPLTHQDIADLAGICRELVSRKLHQLQATGAVLAKRGRIVITDDEQLRQAGSWVSSRKPC